MFQQTSTGRRDSRVSGRTPRVDVVSVAGVHVDMPNELVCFSFLCVSPTSECAPSAEMVEFRWLSVSESLDTLHPIYRNRVIVARTSSCLVEHHAGARMDMLLSHGALNPLRTFGRRMWQVERIKSCHDHHS
jgi:hypothetical protein